jgi:outer membrane protein
MLKFIPLVMLISALTITTAFCADLPGQISLTRDDAVLMAVRKNIDLRVEALNSSIDELSLARSRSIYDPQLTASSSYGDSSYPGETFGITSTVTSVGISQYLPTGGSIALTTQSGYSSAKDPASGLAPKDWLSSVGISISQSLLKNAGRETTELNISLADINLKESLERFRFFITDTVFSVITSYNRLHVLRQTLKAREDALDSAQELRNQLKQKAKPGKLQTMEVANADYAISQRRKDLIDAGKNVRDQEATLRYLLGIEDKLEIIPVDSPSREEPAESETEALQAAIENRPDLKQLRMELESQLLQERVAKRQQLPDLSITAGTGFSGYGTEIGKSFSQIGDGKGGWWSAGLFLNVPLGNTAAKNDYRQSRIRTEQLQQRIRAYEWQVRNAVEADMRSMISARLQMQSADQSLVYAEQRLAEYRKHSLDGGSSVQDLLNAENDLITARNSQLDAVNYFAYSVTLLWRNIGVLLDRQHVHINTADPEQLTRREAPLPAASREAITAAASELALPAAVANPLPAASVVPEQTSPPAAPTYTLKIGNFVVKSQLASASEMVRAAGLESTVKDGPKTLEPMIRLILGSYENQVAASKELDRLRKAYADGFLLGSKEEGYQVYAGSYFNARGAEQEQKRLAALGITVSLAETSVPVPTYTMTVGRYPSREAAADALAKLEQQGLKPELVEVGE